MLVAQVSVPLCGTRPEAFDLNGSLNSNATLRVTRNPQVWPTPPRHFESQCKPELQDARPIHGFNSPVLSCTLTIGLLAGRTGLWKLEKTYLRGGISSRALIRMLGS